MRGGSDSPENEYQAAVASIRGEYARRSYAPQCVGQYSFYNASYTSLILEREKAILVALSRFLEMPLSEAKILDVGCGYGVSLAFLNIYGARRSNLYGLDIDSDRIVQARRKFPGITFQVGNGYSLPYQDAEFDIVQQISVLSSIHSKQLRSKLALEMQRVLRPGGLVIFYDVARTSVFPRALNRLLSLLGSTPNDARVTSGGEDTAVKLTPVRPLTFGECAALFGETSAVWVQRLSPYGPLVQKLGRTPLVLGILQNLPVFHTALLFVARKVGKVKPDREKRSG